MSTSQTDETSFVHWMRDASPYIRAHRGHTFVVYLGGELVADLLFPQLVQDLTLLAGIGVRLVVVHGSQPQVSARLAAANLETRFVGSRRVTPVEALAQVKDATAAVRFDIESQFSHATRVRPLGTTPLRVNGGNYVMARPAGVVDGIDLEFSGDVRRIDGRAISQQLDIVDVVLISSLGYSPTGETFSLDALELAGAVAIELHASKLILLSRAAGVRDAQGALVRELTPREAREYQRREGSHQQELANAVRACQSGVERVHLLDAGDGALLLELFTRDGVGTLVSNAPFDQLRQATIEDVGGIVQLIEPLEAIGALVKRSREKLETEIEHFMVVVRDGATVACGALYPFVADRCGEIACVAVEPAYRQFGFGKTLLAALEQRAVALKLDAVFALTTQAKHWFQEYGYVAVELERLPSTRQALYNFQRNSQVLLKELN